MKMKQKILITGSEGLIGKILTKSLEKEGHKLVLLDKNSQKPVDLLNNNINPYFKNVDTVIHLAVNGFWIDEQKAEENVRMTGNVLDNCSRENVKRIIYTSSINVYNYSDLYLKGGKIDSSTPIIPHAKKDWKKSEGKSSFNYSLSKILCEDLVKNYTEVHNISGINLRLGAVTQNNKPSPDEPDDSAIWLSHKDLTEIIKKAINFNGVANITCVSNNSEKFIDLSPLKEILDYVPKSNSEKYR